MNILSIDTSTQTGSIAIVRDGAVLCEREYIAKSSHAEVLISEIDEALKAAGCVLKDIDAVAVSVGPGSFTGLRIGMATAKGLALALGKPIVGVSSLKALAVGNEVGSRKYEVGKTAEEMIVPCINAYRGEVYAVILNASEGSHDRTCQELSVTPEQLCDLLLKYEGNFIFIGDGAIHYKNIFKERLGDRSNIIERPSYPLAKNIAFLAFEELKQGRSDDLVTLAPNYIRKSDAELKLKI